MKPEQERVKGLLTETVMLLCKNGLQFNKEMKVQGLLGITLDENEVFLIHFDEKFESVQIAASSTSDDNNRVVDNQETQRKQTQQSENNRMSKFPLRSTRPMSRFGTQSVHKSKRPRIQMQSFNSRVSAKSNLSHSEGQEAEIIGHIENELVQVKKEEDSDLIIIDLEGDVKPSSALVDDRAAMLSSYMTEIPDNEAQNVMTEFARVSSANASHQVNRTLQRRGRTAEHTSGEVDGNLHYGSLLSNEANLSQNFNSSASMDGQQWDSPALQGLSLCGAASTSNVPAMYCRRILQPSSAVPVPATCRKPFYCSHPGCSAQFQFNVTLRQHIESKHGNRRFICDFPGCQKAFCYSPGLSRHKRLHYSRSQPSDDLDSAR